MQDSIPKTIKGYQILERIGAGEFGAVYRAQQSTINREVAIKFILPSRANQADFIRRFDAEAQVIARLEHPHIIPLFDYWRDPDGAYLVMRYLKGGSIRDVLDREAFSLEAASHLLDQLSLALEFAHRHEIIHRDIKPGNILLDEDGNAYLADFGIAKDLKIVEGQTQPDAVVGSLHYISPEQARSEAITARTDIYSLGVTLYEMIAGELPFKGASSIERLFKHISEALPYIENLPENRRDSVNECIQIATAKDPQHRYPDTLSFAKAFREAAGIGNTTQEFSVLEQLTLREHEVLQLIADGLANREIAENLFITYSTTKWYIRQIYQKLGVRSRVQAIIRARELDLISTTYSEMRAAVPMQNANESQANLNLPEPENPYKGLLAFQSADARDFFGREDLVEKLLERLREESHFKRFLAIVGPSGSGKSSLVRAGLIPAIWKGKLPKSDKWFVVDIIPSDRPLDKLEASLVRISSNYTYNLNEQLSRDSKGLLRIADIILPNDGSELVVVIDQFEEIFTLITDENERQHFLDLLYTAVTAPASRVRIIVTLRADYYDKPLHYPQIGEMLGQRMETILPLGAKAIERAVRGPAERVRVQFETGLVEQIVSEMTYQAGALPLLQYALTELFEQRQGRLLTQNAYQAMGGAVGALAHRVDEVYKHFSEDLQALTEQIFLRLVTLGEGADDTRRRTPRSELNALSPDIEKVDEIIDTLVAYRLLAVDTDVANHQPTVEVAHEAILSEWHQLREWLNNSRDDIRQGQLLALASQQWRNNQKDASYLLSGTRLSQFELWQAKTRMSLTPREKAFIQASSEQREVLTHAELERQSREKALEQREIELMQKALVRARTFVSVFVVAALISTSLGIFAFIQRNVAVEAQHVLADEQENTLEALDIAQRSGLTFAADAALSIGETDLAISLALASVGDDENNMLPETIRLLEQIENQAGPRIWKQMGVKNCRRSVSRDYQYFVHIDCSNENNLMTIWDMVTGEEVGRITDDEIDDFGGFSGDGSQLLTWGFPDNTSTMGGVHYTFWDTRTWEIIREYTIETPHFPPSFSADSAIIFTEDVAENYVEQFENGDILVVDRVSMRSAETGEVIREYRFDDIIMQDFDWSDDGRMGVQTGWILKDGERTDDYRSIVFDLATGDILYSFDRSHADTAIDGDTYSAEVGFTNHDRSIYLSSNPNYIIDLATGENNPYVAELSSHMSRPDPNFEFVYAGQPGDYHILNLQNGEIHDVQTNAVSLNPISGRYFTQDLGRMDEFQIWDTNGRDDIVHQINMPGSTNAVAYSPDGTYLATISWGWGTTTATIRSTTVIYDATTLEEVRRLDATGIVPWGLDWSPDSRYLATGTYQEGIILWDVARGEELRRFTGTQDHIRVVRFTNDGQRILGTHGNQFSHLSYDVPPYIVMWDVETGQEIRRYQFGEEYLPNHGVISIDLHPSLPLAIVGLNVEQLDATNVFRTFTINLDTGETRNLGSFAGGYFLPDEKRILLIPIVNSVANTIEVYEYESMSLIYSAGGLDEQFFGYALSPDGKYLVTGVGPLAFESAVSLWDVETGQVIRRYFGHAEQTMIPHVAFNADETQFVSTSFDSQLIVWNVQTQSTLEWVRENRVARDFSCAERERYHLEPLCEQ